MGSHFACTCTLSVCFPHTPLKCGYSVSFGHFLGFAHVYVCCSLWMLRVLGILLKFSLNGGKERDWLIYANLGFVSSRTLYFLSLVFLIPDGVLIFY